MAASTWSSSVTSQATPIASCPSATIASAHFPAYSSRTSTQTRLAPSRASSSAMPPMMLGLVPVTSAVLPSSFKRLPLLPGCRDESNCPAVQKMMLIAPCQERASRSSTARRWAIFQFTTVSTQDVMHTADVWRTLAAAEPVDHYVRSDRQLAIIGLCNPNVGYEPAGPGPRVLPVSVTAVQPHRPGTQSGDVVVDEDQVALGVSFRQVGGGDHITGVFGKQVHPVVQAPLIQELRFPEEEVLHLFAQRGACWQPSSLTRSGRALVVGCHSHFGFRLQGPSVLDIRVSQSLHIGVPLPPESPHLELIRR